MSSIPTKNTKKIKTLLRRKSRKFRRRISRKNHYSCKKKPQKGLCNNGKVSEKLEALKNLMPAATNKNNGRVVKADQLFQETADYIVLLRTQVFVLQELIKFYGSSGKESSNDINLVP